MYVMYSISESESGSTKDEKNISDHTRACRMNVTYTYNLCFMAKREKSIWEISFGILLGIYIYKHMYSIVRMGHTVFYIYYYYIEGEI